MELAILIGLQASGKTSFCQARLAATHAHVSKDRFPNSRNAAKRQATLVSAALASGRSVVIDNTNVTVEDRASLIALARAAGASVAGYYFESRVADCFARYRARSGLARVPDVAIYATVKRLRHPDPSEGFDELFHVRLVGERGFEVTPWIAETDDDEERRA